MIAMQPNGRARLVAGLTLATLLLSGCGQLRLPGQAAEPAAPAQTAAAPQPAAPVASPAPAGSLAGRQTVAVRRGPIAEQVPLDGRVAALEETQLSLSSTGRIESVAVTPGQMVEAGQVLVKSDTRETSRDLVSAKRRLEASTVRLAQTQAQLQSQLRRAQDDLARLRQGPSDAERRAATAAVSSARANLDRARDDLARQTAGPSELDLRTAEQQLAVAQIAAQKAEAEQARLEKGPDPAQIRQAESQVALAQAGLQRAQADYTRLQQGPDPAALRNATRDVDLARAELEAAQSTKDKNVSKATREAAIARAQARLQEAEERLAIAKQPPKPWDVETAANNLANAKDAVLTARDRLEAANRGPDSVALATAAANADAARIALGRAQESYDRLQNASTSGGATPAAYAAVNSAQVALEAAQARVAELNRPNSLTAQRELEERIAALTSALNAIASPANTADDAPIDPNAYDVILLQRNIEQDRAQTEQLSRDLEASQVTAPFAGVVTAVLARIGESIVAGRPLVALARPGDPVVRVDLSDDDAGRLAPGQRATVKVDGLTGDPLQAELLRVVTPDAGGRRVALIKPTWTGPASFGSYAQVSVTVQQRDSALLVPRKAVRTANQRRFVELVEGTARRSVDVTVGISSETDVEILSGLREGQIVAVQP